MTGLIPEEPGTPNEPARFLAVGHCGPDTWMLRTAVQRVLPDATLEPVAGDDELEAALDGGSPILLVNRRLDGDFAAGDGIELIRGLASSGHRALLVSDLPDARAAAEEAGGLPGFGKTALHDEETAAALRRACRPGAGGS